MRAYNIRRFPDIWRIKLYVWVYIRLRYLFVSRFDTKLAYNYEICTTVYNETISDYKKIIEPQIMNGTREERGVYNSRFATPQEFKNYFKDCKWTPFLTSNK